MKGKMYKMTSHKAAEHCKNLEDDSGAGKHGNSFGLYNVQLTSSICHHLL